MLAMEVFWKAVLCVFAADFLSGLFHWLEDSYGEEHWPITGVLVTQPNQLHHRNPRYFTRHSWWKSADVQVVIAAVVLASAFGLGVLHWTLWLTMLVAVNANEIHKWSHRTRAENGVIIGWLQDRHVLPSAAHHARHHQGDRSTHYCLVTEWLNPVLDRIRFWRFCERTVYLVFRVRTRDQVEAAFYASGQSDANSRPVISP